MTQFLYQPTLDQGYLTTPIPALTVPEPPESGFVRIYFKDNNKQYYQYDDGAEHEMTAGGGGGGGSGDVVGPGSSTANAIALFNGSSGKLLKNSGITVDASDNLSTSGFLSGANIRFLGGANHVDVSADAGTASYTLTWPVAQASSAGVALLNDGFGGLYWGSVSGSGFTGSLTTGRIPYADSTNSLADSIIFRSSNGSININSFSNQSHSLLFVNNTNSVLRGQRIKGSSGQSVPYWEVVDNSDNPLVQVSSLGRVGIGLLTGTVNDMLEIRVPDGGTGGTSLTTPTYGNGFGINLGSSGEGYLFHNHAKPIYLMTSATIRGVISAAGNFHFGGSSDPGANRVLVTNFTSTDVALKLRGAIGQSANAFEYENSSGQKRVALGEDGQIKLYESPANGTSSFAFKAAPSMSGDIVGTLPPDGGLAGQVWTTSGGSSPTFSWTDGLTDTGVIPGDYLSANISVDSKGRITAASNGGTLLSATSIDLTAAGNTVLYTVPALKSVMVGKIVVKITSENAISNVGSISLGTSPSADEIIRTTVLTGLSSVDKYFTINPSGTSLTANAADQIILKVVNGYVATTAIATIYLYGSDPNAAGVSTGTGIVYPGIANGRLTLDPGQSVMKTSQFGKTTVFYTPHDANQISIYNGLTWDLLTFVETPLSLSGFSPETIYDIWGYNNSGVLGLEATAWAGDLTRIIPLDKTLGVPLKSTDLTRRYLGSIRTTSVPGECEYSFGGFGIGGATSNLFVWNCNNRLTVRASTSDTASSWPGAGAFWRPANGSSINRVNFICGMEEDIVEATTSWVIESSSAFVSGVTAIGFDSVTTPSGLFGLSNNVEAVTVSGFYAETAAPGFHFIAPIEYASGGVTFYGNAGLSYVRSGFFFKFRM